METNSMTIYRNNNNNNNKLNAKKEKKKKEKRKKNKNKNTRKWKVLTYQNNLNCCFCSFHHDTQ